MTAQVRAPSRLSEESSIYCCLPKKQCEDVMELRQSAFVLTSEIRRETDANEICRFTTLFDSEMHGIVLLALRVLQQQARRFQDARGS
jgi:hypothetical protein